MRKKIKKKWKTLIQKFRVELSRNIYLAETDRKYWINHAGSLPEKLVTYFLRLLEKENKIAKKCMERAIDEKPEMLAAIIKKEKDLKLRSHEFIGAEEESTAERSLENKLKQI